MRNIKKTEALKEAYGEEGYNRIQFVEADLTDDESMGNAIKGATYVIHVASPLPSTGVKYAKNQMVIQAVDGMRTILKACKEHNVLKLVVTSSLSVIVGKKMKQQMAVYDENDFAFDKKMNVDDYTRSKSMQEQEIFSFKKQCEEED